MNLSFNYIYHKADGYLKLAMYKMMYTWQNLQWHPEGNAYNHAKIVTNRAAITGNIDLIVAAFFHDLGKVDTTFINKKGTWAAYRHEFASLKYVERYKDFIKDLGANYDAVWHIVKEHMRIQKYSEMRPHKKRKLEENPYYDLICKFAELDDMSTLTDDELKEL